MSTPPPSPEAPAIRPAGAEAAGELAAIHAAAFPPGEAWAEGAIAALLATPGCFALRQGMAGFVMARVAADEAELLTLAVCPPARRRGIGLALVDQAAAVALALGARSLWLEVGAENAAARALYAKAGFVEAGRRRDYYGAGRDALVLRLSLS
ncbi:MAG: GNAT family N-acetyltransferase [Rhodovarius sp.]|nr:GNAT family N-acetyltransferase [Rhodovarius sp.]MCX7931617.1 GNAT family N-acetyltransferase [Rhodovarius sp.]MDW8314378.1 GNAT family N-acetyltransferase [Rhodovarius sp.]